MELPMASYDLIERLTSTFRHIERELAELKSELSACRLLAGRVFELPAVTKEAEHEPLTTIQVKISTSASAPPSAPCTTSRISLFSSSRRTAAARRPCVCRG